MSPEVERRGRGGSRGGRFATVIVTAAIASSVAVVAMVLGTTTPEEAREQRAAPILPPPVAELRATVLRQVTWHPCRRRTTTVEVPAPSPPEGYRSVVTAVVRAGAPVRTGTTLVRVADQPVVAIVTKAVLFRDLLVGDRGADVRAVEQALASAGVVAEVDGSLDAGTVEAWRSRFDHSGPTDRIALDRIVAVPRRGDVTRVSVSVGRLVRPGTALLEVGARSDTFRCDIGEEAAHLRADDLTLQVRGKAYEIGALVVDDRQEGQVEVRPRGEVDSDAGRLAIEFSSSRDVVLAAPLGALRTAADGRTSVVVVDGSMRREVPVETGVTAQGLIEVSGDGLEEGVDVLLFDPPDPSGGAG